MAKIIEGTYVIKAKLKGTKTVVYCAGIRSDYHVEWTEDLSKAVKLHGIRKGELDDYVSNIWRLNDHYNTLDEYAVAFNVVNIDKPPCNYAAFFGSIDKKSRMIDISDTTAKVARSISKDARKNFPLERYFLFKSRTKFTGKYLPWKYDLIDNETGLHSKDYYFIMEVPKNA